MNMKQFVVVLFIILGAIPALAQPRIQITASPDLTNLSFGSLTFSNDLPNNQVLFQVDITGVPNLPGRDDVQIYGEVKWKENANASEDLMAKFLTVPFSRNKFSFTNIDLGSRGGITISKDQTYENVINRNLKKGKLIGQYTMFLKLLRGPAPIATLAEAENIQAGHPSFLASDVQVLLIESVVQNLVITEPTIGDIFDAGNVTASWTPLNGVSSYKVKANYLRYPTQSPEDALRSGEPLIDDKDVGIQTSVNLRTLMTREWTPGKTVVLQVYGIIPGVGSSNIYSQPVTFLIRPQMNAAMQTIINNLSILTQTFASSLPPNLLNQLGSGNVVINEIRLEDGTVLSEAQITAIIRYLQANPANVLNVSYRQP